MTIGFRAVFAAISLGGAVVSTVAFPQDPAKGKVAVPQKNLVDLLITSSARADGNAEVQFTSAGLNGYEIHQLKSENERTVISRIMVGPVAAASKTNLSHTRLILEKAPGMDRIVLEVHPSSTPGKVLRLALPAETTPSTGAVTMGIIQTPITDPPGGSGGSNCYTITYTSDRCGTITACCPSTSVYIDGVNCFITCL